MPATVSALPHKIDTIEHFEIPLSGKVKLAARLWRPRDALKHPVPALLEFLPYRKTDGTHARDAVTHAYLAGHGYACLRVDLRGTGDSQGVFEDEYSEQELDDAVEVIGWLARQKWCDGTVGMFGMSWGGFNALQVAARRPAALKAIVTLCSTDDRYEDDIHYKGGSLLAENIGWAAAMLAILSRPPDPKCVGRSWKKLWLDRLNTMPFLALPWLEHPHRDAYWKRASVCEDFGRIEAATLVVGGFNDAYVNAVPRLMRGLRSVRKAIIGPWTHAYPHLGAEPQIGFLHEMLRWFDRWLKDKPTGVHLDPDFRFFIADPHRPTGAVPEEFAGRWLGDAFWGSGQTTLKTFHLTTQGIAMTPGGDEMALTLDAPIRLMTGQGEYCAMFGGAELPADQQADDAAAITFDSPPLAEGIDLAGQPVAELDIAVDQPVAQLVVRLAHIWPSGEVSRLSYQVFNPAMLTGRDTPKPLVPGKRIRVKVKLNDLAAHVPAGHRLRLSVATSCFPLVWPVAAPVALTGHAGASQLLLPLRRVKAFEPPVEFKPAEGALPARVKQVSPPRHERRFATDDKTGAQTLTILDDFGREEIRPHGLVTQTIARETYSLQPGDPLSARMATHWTEEMTRATWQVRTETHTRFAATKTHWLVEAKLEAFEGKKKVASRTWKKKIPRQLQ